MAPPSPAWHAAGGRRARGAWDSSAPDRWPELCRPGGADASAGYAIYSFSASFSIYRPFEYWADWAPPRREAIDIPAGTNRVFPPAYVRWRAWLNNDSDFLEPWQKRSPENDHAMLETVLRLISPTPSGTRQCRGPKRPAPRSYAVRPRPRRLMREGLVDTLHHTSPLGSNLSNWDAFWKHEGKETPPLSVKDPEKLKAFWRYHVETAHRAGFEVVVDPGLPRFPRHPVMGNFQGCSRR